MTYAKSFYGLLASFVILSILLLGCGKSPSNIESALNGSWVDGVQSGPIKIYITELRFNNGNFEWTWDDDLQQRGTYDTNNGVLTVTISNNYGSPQRLLGDYSRPYSINGNVLTWGGSDFTKK